MARSTLLVKSCVSIISVVLLDFYLLVGTPEHAKPGPPAVHLLPVVINVPSPPLGPSLPHPGNSIYPYYIKLGLSRVDNTAFDFRGDPQFSGVASLLPPID